MDSIIAHEDQLIEKLGDSVEVDVRDVGSGEVHLFIFTSDPGDTIEAARPIWKLRG